MFTGVPLKVGRSCILQLIVNETDQVQIRHIVKIVHFWSASPPTDWNSATYEGNLNYLIYEHAKYEISMTEKLGTRISINPTLGYQTVHSGIICILSGSANVFWRGINQDFLVSYLRLSVQQYVFYGGTLRTRQNTATLQTTFSKVISVWKKFRKSPFKVIVQWPNFR